MASLYCHKIFNFNPSSSLMVFRQLSKGNKAYATLLSVSFLQITFELISPLQANWTEGPKPPLYQGLKNCVKSGEWLGNSAPQWRKGCSLNSAVLFCWLAQRGMCAQWGKEGIREYVARATVIMRGRRHVYGWKRKISRKADFMEQLVEFKWIWMSGSQCIGTFFAIPCARHSSISLRFLTAKANASLDGK